MRGYKGMNKDMTCRGMKFEIGKTYHVDGNIELCKNGLHFCKHLYDVFDYYAINNSRYFEVETEKQLVISDDVKSVTSELTILRELTDVEINRALYDGDNYGDGFGYGNGFGYGTESGHGYGDGFGYGEGDGNGYGCGQDAGYGYGEGGGFGCGYDNGYSFGDGGGFGGDYDYQIQKILVFVN